MTLVRLLLAAALPLALAPAALARPPGDPPIAGGGIGTGSADGSVELGLDALYPFGNDVYSLFGASENNQFSRSGGLVGSGSIETDIALLTCPGAGQLPQYLGSQGTEDIQVGEYEPDGQNCVVRTTQTYDWECESGPCVGSAEPPTINSEANAGYDLLAGSVYLRATPYTESIGLDDSHFVRARASAGLSDWVWVEAPGPTATITLSADLTDYQPDMSFPVDFTTQAYGDMVTNPDLSTVQANLVDGSKEIEAVVGLAIRYGYETIQVCVPPDGEGEDICHDELSYDEQAIEAFHRRGFDLLWSDNGTPGAGDENDDYPYTVSYEYGAAIATSQVVQAVVATNTWVLIGGYGSLDMQCEGPLVCDITSHNAMSFSASASAGTLYSLTGIAGITVPELDAFSATGATLLGLSMRARRGRA